MNSFWLTDDYIFANDFLRFLTGHFKKRKSFFLKSEKTSNTYSRTLYRRLPCSSACNVKAAPTRATKLNDNYNTIPCDKPKLKTLF